MNLKLKFHQISFSKFEFLISLKDAAEMETMVPLASYSISSCRTLCAESPSLGRVLLYRVSYRVFLEREIGNRRKRQLSMKSIHLVQVPNKIFDDQTNWLGRC